MTATQEEALSHLRQRKSTILALSGLQAQLLDVIGRYMKEKGLSVSAFCQLLPKAKSCRMKEALNRERVLASTPILQEIGRITDQPRLIQEILEKIRFLPDAWLGLTVIRPEAIEQGFAFLEAQIVEGGEFNLTEQRFAECFAPDDEIVFKLFRRNLEAWKALEDQETGQRLRVAFEAGDWKKRLKVDRTDDGDFSAKLEKFKSLLERLRPMFPGREKLAAALGMCPNTIRSASFGEVALKTLDALIKRSEILMQTHSPDPSPSIEKPDEAEDMQPAKLAVCAGGDSPLGVRYVLGPETFQDLGGYPGSSGIEIVRKVLELSRAHLNLLSQIQDTRQRALIRQALGSEVEELGVAIQLFSAEYPNRLTGLYEQQRRVWTREKGSKPTKGEKS